MLVLLIEQPAPLSLRLTITILMSTVNNLGNKILAYLVLPKQPPFPQIDIIGAVVIVWSEGGKLSGLFCAILCATIVHSAMHTHMNRLTVLCIGFCLTGPISLCLDSFFIEYCMYSVCCMHA